MTLISNKRTPPVPTRFAQALAELERAVSILTWGTVGLIAGGSGFSNSDLFERNKAAVLEKEARKEARFENEQIWRPVLDWACRAGKISKTARDACIVYNAESPRSFSKRPPLQLHLSPPGIRPKKPNNALVSKNTHCPNLPHKAVSVRFARGPRGRCARAVLFGKTRRRYDREKPHGMPSRRNACLSFVSCRVALRYETTDDGYRPVWQSFARRAA